MYALATHHAVNRLHVFFLSFCINAFNPHRAGMVAGSAFRTGSTIFFQFKQVKPFEKPHQIPHRADNAPEPLNKKTAHQDYYGKKAAKIQIRPITALRSCKTFQRADIAKIPACESKP